MDKEEMEAKVHELAQLSFDLGEVRKAESHVRARDRVMRRDDVVSCTIRPDGSLECLGDDGSVTIRVAGWRGR